MNAHELLILAIKASIFITVLGLGLSATWRDATVMLREPGLLARSLIAMFVAMPAVAASVVWALDLPSVVEVAVVAMAIAPVPPILPRKELKSGGRAGYAVGLLVVSALISVVYVPLAVQVLDWIFDRAGVISPLAIAKIVLTSVLVPLVVGIAVRHWALAFAERVSSAVLLVGTIMLVAGVVPMLIAVWPAVQALFGNGTVLIIAIVVVIGLAIGHLLGGPFDSDRTVLALSTSARHPAVALAVGTSGVLEVKPEVAAILLYVIVATLLGIPYTYWRLHRRNAAAGGTS